MAAALVRAIALDPTPDALIDVAYEFNAQQPDPLPIKTLDDLILRHVPERADTEADEREEETVEAEEGGAKDKPHHPPAGSALVRTFSFEGNDIRTVMIDGVILWVAKDVCDRLRYVDGPAAVSRHCRGSVIRRPIPDALGRLQETRVLTEADVFRLIVGSELPDAERFRVWLFEQVLPSIRKTGSYTAPGAPALTKLEGMVANWFQVTGDQGKRITQPTLARRYRGGSETRADAR